MKIAGTFTGSHCPIFPGAGKKAGKIFKNGVPESEKPMLSGVIPIPTSTSREFRREFCKHG
jgi:hypothetical protein